MAIDGDDPRVYFAAERTLLAWIRTGLSLMGLGFVVAKFGLIIAGDANAQSPPGSTLIGVGLVLLGSISIAIAAANHLRFCRDLRETDRPKPNSTITSVGLAIAIAIIGVVLAGFILFHSSIT